MNFGFYVKTAVAGWAIAMAISTQVLSADDPESKKSAMAPVFAVARFASESCPSLTQDEIGVRAAIAVFGVSRDDVMRDPIHRAKYEALLARYRSDPEKYCSIILASFGPNGAILPDIVRRK